MVIWSVIPHCPRFIRKEQARLWLATSTGRIHPMLLSAAAEAWRSVDQVVRHRRPASLMRVGNVLPLVRWRAACAMLGALLTLASTPANAESITYADGTFHSLDWQLVIESTRGNGGDVFVEQRVAEGQPDAFGAVRYDLRPALPFPAASLRTLHVWKADAYQPSLQAAIESIDFSIDFKVTKPPHRGAAQSFRPVLVQDGVIYVADGWSSSSPIWESHAKTGLRQADWTDIVNGTRHPDFSCRGGPIEFGFICASGTTQGGILIETGYDNLRVTIHRTPRETSPHTD